MVKRTVGGNYPEGERYGVTIPDADSTSLPVGTLFTQRCETEPSSIPVRDENYYARSRLAVGPLNTLIAAARTLCDNVTTVGTHNRIDTEHIDKLRQALDDL